MTVAADRITIVASDCGAGCGGRGSVDRFGKGAHDLGAGSHGLGLWSHGLKVISHDSPAFPHGLLGVSHVLGASLHDSPASPHVLNDSPHDFAWLSHVSSNQLVRFQTHFNHEPFLLIKPIF